MPLTTQSRIIALAQGQVGTHEGRSGGHWNNDQKYSDQTPGLEWSDGQPWCDTFVHWLFGQLRLISLLPDVTAKSPGGSASCDTTGAAYKIDHRWSEYPAVGAQIFFGTAKDLSHTGIVERYDDTFVYTVEGNTNASGAREGDGVYAKRHLRADPHVVGYGYPRYPDPIVSADPAWGAHVKPAPSPSVAERQAFKLGRIDVLDTSHFNRVTLAGVQAAKAAGVRAMWLKCTQRLTWRDATYNSRRRLLNGLLPSSAYHFAEPLTSSGNAQARYFLKTAKLKPGDPAPMLDLEGESYRGHLSTASLDAWVAGFVTEVVRQLGVTPWIYTQFNLLSTHGCPLWIASYSDSMHLPRIPTPWTRFTLWQFSDGVYGKPREVAGLGRLDLSTYNGNPFDLTAPSYRIPATQPATPIQPVPSVPAAPGAGGHTSPTTTFVNLQFNSQHTDAPSSQLRDTVRLADVAGLNEIETTWQRLALKAMTGYGMFPTVGSAASVPILWRKARFRLIDKGSHQIHPGVKGVTPPRYVNWVLLEDLRTGLVFTRVNTQLAHHGEVAGRLRVLDQLPGQNHRVLLGITELRATVLERATRGPVIWGGDLNVDYRAEKRLHPSELEHGFPLVQMGGIGKLDMPAGGTHGSRAIDWTGHVGQVTRTGKVRVLPLGISDHQGVLTPFTLALSAQTPARKA